MNPAAYRSPQDLAATAAIDELIAAARAQQWAPLEDAALALTGARDAVDTAQQGERDRQAAAVALAARIALNERTAREIRETWNRALTADPASKDLSNGARAYSAYETSRILLRSAIEFSDAILKPAAKLASLRAALALNLAESAYIRAQQLPRIAELCRAADAVRAIDPTAQAAPLAADSLPSITASQLEVLTMRRYGIEESIKELIQKHPALQENQR